MNTVKSMGPKMPSRPIPLVLSALIALIWSGILLVPGVARAQTSVDSLTDLTVDIWPDYDRPAVLVLLTGRLPANAVLPAQVTIPLPPDATLNAVARLTLEGAMIDDIDFTVADNALIITVPDERFRVEYYAPYAESEGERSYRFVWQANDLSVEQLAVTVQQPAGATSMETSPAAMSTSEGPDGLTYFHLPPDTVLAGDRYSSEFSYVADGNQLTVAALDLQPPQSDLSAAPADASLLPGSENGFDINWPLLLVGAAGLLVIAVLAWQVISSRQAARPTKAKPRPARSPQKTQPSPPPQTTTGQTGVRFCHQCGQSVSATDKFCRNCGAKTKTAG